MLVFSSQQLHYKWSQPISLHKIASELYMQSFNYGMRIYYIYANCFSPQRTNFMYKQYHLCIYLGKKLRMSIQLKRTGSRSIIRQHSNIVIVHQHFRLGKTNSYFTKTFPSVMNHSPKAPYGKRNSELKSDVSQKM